MKLTRRRLAVAVLGSAAASAMPPQQPAPPRTPEDEIKAARARVQANSDALAKEAVPMATEPAFQFRA